MQRYNLANIIGGWLAFLLAATVYILTVEPTASFWDCGEFITAAYKLQIGHPPGAPLYMLLGRLFSLFAGDVSRVALSINILSALASAFTIMFLFWTITHLAKKMFAGNNTYSTTNIIIILGSGFTGALAYAFSDSFWFSAVEAEVYALSSFFTAVVFWAILKWENVADEKYANRWLILIAYLMGLSIGVHLLNLLTIPAIVFVFYFKKYTPTIKGILAAAALSAALLLSFMYGIIHGMIVAASWFELYFVNKLGLPFKSGVIVYLLIGVSLLVYALIYTRKNRKPLLHTIFLGITVILIGYSSFSLVVIRSLANPPMDQNSPDNVFSLLYYLNREQYGNRPLLHGQYYNAPVTGDKEGRPAYIKQDGRYVSARQSFSYNYDSRFKTLFPRMYSSDPDHVRAYREWGQVKGRPVRVTRDNGETEIINKPTFIENLRFFARYQLGHMYFRYFMWNFAGRQNDIQGEGGILEGNWISGIHMIDEARLGPQYGLPERYQNNKARNKYYMLPLILGLVGLLMQLQKNRKDFLVVSLLFLFTGVAIVLYLNQTPFQPRERDYAYAGSFYAFAIWIGLGVIAVHENLKSRIKGQKGALLAALLTLVFIPGLMALQNRDDHDRSDRYTARDIAWNYLQSCAPDAILFTFGDNDTFPLWYLQEVEGIRTDVRVVNLSYLSADWYIEQMKRKVYESDPLPVSMTFDQYVQGTRDIIYLFDRMTEPADLRSALDYALSDDPSGKIQVSPTEYVDYIPSRRFSLPVDPKRVIETGTVEPSDAHLIEPAIEWQIPRNYITKSGLTVLDILASNNWERPLCFAVTVPSDEYLGLQDYFRLEGMAYRLVPVLKQETDNFTGFVGSETMYRNITEEFKWGNMYDPSVYLDETNIRMALNMRSNMARLAKTLIDEGKTDSAVVILDQAMNYMPKETIPYNYFIVPIIESYYLAGEPLKASGIARDKAELLKKELNYYLSLKRELRKYVEFEQSRALTIYRSLLRAVTGNDLLLEQEMTNDLNSYIRFLEER